jgi:hypothetical protein
MDEQLDYLNSKEFDNIKFVSFDEPPAVENVIQIMDENKDHKLVYIDAIGNM